MILIVGHGRAGKDYAGEWLDEHSPFRYAGSTSKYLCKYVAEKTGQTLEECYAERHDNRELWFLTGREVRENQPGVLINEALEHGDVVAGVRDAEEVEYACASGRFMSVIWIENPLIPPDPTLKFDLNYCAKQVATHRCESNPISLTVLINDGTEQFDSQLRWFVDNGIIL